MVGGVLLWLPGFGPVSSKAEDFVLSFEPGLKPRGGCVVWGCLVSLNGV